MNNQNTVLIIDDEVPLLDLYGDALENAGLLVHKAPSAREGVALALAHHPDIILVDVEMPGMTGHEVVNEIRNDAWGISAKIMYLTNLDNTDSMISASNHGSSKYMIKANSTPHDVVNEVLSQLEKKTTS